MTADEIRQVVPEWPALHPYTTALRLQARTGREVTGKTIKFLLSSDAHHITSKLYDHQSH
jgi:hypothetical protein